jgi:hypothetical protein
MHRCLYLLGKKVSLLTASKRLNPKALARLFLLEGVDKPKIECNAYLKQ